MNTKTLKRKLGTADFFLIVVNLIPVWGVWFHGWNAREVFMVYCLETIIIGLYTLLKLAIAGIARPRDEWSNSGGIKVSQPFWFFMLFFTAHFGIFVAVQMSIFLETSGAEKALGISGTWDFITHFNKYLSSNSKWFLLSLVVSYGFLTLKDFVISGAFRSTSLGIIMFEPYGRIFVQQFTVILGSLFIGMGAGKIFITLFAAIKIFFDVFMNFRGILSKMGKSETVNSGVEQ